MTNLLSILSFLIEIFSRAHAKGKKILDDFKFGIVIGRFPSDGAESMAVKGLNVQMNSKERKLHVFKPHFDLNK